MKIFYERMKSMIELPTISVIIPCFNSASKLPSCINSIKRQSYPQEKIEFIVIDDKSDDSTVRVAEDLNCKVYISGEHDPERSKSIGIEKAEGEWLFFIDDDNILPNDHWLEKLTMAVLKEKAVGGQAAYFFYNKNDTISDRYMALFGVTDPAFFYMNKRDHLMAIEKEWNRPGELVRQNGEYYVIRFSKKDFLTVGSQGFLIKNEYVKETSYKPYFYHIDSNYELVVKGKRTYVFLKDGVIHYHSKDTGELVKKCKRNITQFHSDNHERKYKYDINIGQMIKLGIIMGTIIIPFTDALKGFVKIHDLAWLVHPIICFRVSFMYAIITLKSYIRNFMSNKRRVL